VSPGGHRLVGIGNFTAINGRRRYRAFMLDLGRNTAKLNRWYYRPLRHPCRAAGLPDQLRGVDFSPKGGYFVIVATGFVPQSRYRSDQTDVCDAAARFGTNVVSPSKPQWINYTGGDSLYSVSVTGSAVYVQGHERWLDNPNGINSWGGPPGSTPIYRPGIGAINPVTGHALSWNPMKSRLVGGKVLYATNEGLWVGSDGPYFGKDSNGNWLYHERIAFCPNSLSSG
jgi:hypothetical protein